ncbi:hypothetical protein DV736_g2655, partial [Chaetothyriales sp. CBS 134916]
MAGASQCETTSQGSQGGPLLLDLAKYSYATLPMNSVAPVPWIHISNTVSLVALFETRRSLSVQGDVQEKSIFKVLKDPEIMEELELQALGRESQLAVERSNDAIQHSRDQNVAVITKAPVIAVKYPINEREVRRFQIRFQSDEHYYEAMKLFSRAGVRPVEAGTFPSRPRTAVSNDSPTGVAPTAQCQSVSSRPAMATSYSTVVTAPSAMPRHSTYLSGLMPPPSHFSAPPGAGERIVRPSVPDNIHTTSNSSAHEFLGVLGSNSVAPSAKGKSSSTPWIGESVSLLNQGRSTIEPYVPRPSTVPDKYSQHLSQILPPKRELPFGKKIDSSREAPKELRDWKRVSAEPAVSTVSGKAGEDNGLVNTSPESQGSPQGTSRRRRPPPRVSSSRSAAPKKSRSTKKRVNKPTLKTRPMPKQPDLTVPSIEEHLHDGEIPALKTSMLEDTQALLERAAARLQKGSIQRSIAHGATTNRPGEEDDNHAVAALYTQSGTDQDAPKHPMSHEDHTTSRSTATTPQNAGSAAVDDMAMAYSQLMQQPEFDNSEDKMEGWANGHSAEARKAAIDKFICDAYQDKRFWTLCRLLEGRVDALMIWPKVLSNPSVDEPGGGLGGDS